MPRKIPDGTRQLMEELYTENLPVAEIARRADVSYATAYVYTRAKQRGFMSSSDYQEHLVKQKGFASRMEYEEHLAKQRGFASRMEYEEHLAKQRQQQPINQLLSELIEQRLAELVKTQKWLAQQLGVTEGAVSRYLSGKTRPKKSLQENLFEILELPYQTLDDLVENN